MEKNLSHKKWSHGFLGGEREVTGKRGATENPMLYPFLAFPVQFQPCGLVEDCAFHFKTLGGGDNET